MKIISICGAHSGCGKTTVAEAILQGLEGRWGALKYTRTAFYTTVSDETYNASQSKDTFRLRRAGAERVIRIQAPPEELQESLNMAMALMADCDGVVTEGNSLIEFLNPDIVIFVFGRDRLRIKPSAKDILQKADIVVGWSETSENILNINGSLDRLIQEIKKRLP
jgi:molybdopterin-guanine dinucleotide biosynthesis protein